MTPLKTLLLTLFLLTSLYPYNYSWSNLEDITTPNPPPCTSSCGCDSNGNPISCDCPPNTCCFNNSGAPSPGGGGWGSSSGSSGGSLGSKLGSPVYLKSGFFTWNTKDINIIDKPSLHVNRNYIAHEAHLGLFGNSTISNYEKLFIKTVKYNKDKNSSKDIPSIYYIFRQIDGSRYFFKYHEDNNTFIDIGNIKVKPTIIDYKKDIVTLTYPNKTIETYKQGYLHSRVDSNGNTLTLKYDTNNLLQKVISNSSSLNFFYNSNGFVSKVIDNTDRTWNYEYDNNGNLIKAINPLGHTVTYTYKSFKYPNDAKIDYLITDIKNPEDKSIIKVTYDNNGKVSSYTKGELTYTYNYINQTTISKTDNLNRTITYTIDSNGYINKIKDPLGLISQKSFSNDGLTSVSTDKNSNTYTKIYDKQGRIISTSNPLNQTTNYFYENNQSIKPNKIEDSLGYITSFIYDNNNNLIKQINTNNNKKEYSYDSKGNTIELIDSLNNKTKISYNSVNLPIKITNAKNNSIYLTYTNLNQIKSIKDDMGKSITYSYDLLGNLIQTKDSLGNNIIYTYDKINNLTSITDPTNNKTTYEYDDYSRLIKETYPDNSKTIYSYNIDNTLKQISIKDKSNNIISTTSYTYDSNSRLLTQNTNSNSSTFTYDNEDNLLSVNNKNSNLTFSYDKINNLTNENQLGINISYTYDKNSNLISTSFLNQTITYTRDKLSNITKISMPNNKEINLVYDKNSIPTKTIYPNNTSEIKNYDSIYNLNTINLTNKTINYTYDKSNLITSYNNNNYSYDDIGRLIKENQTTYNLDKAGNILNNNSIYDKSNNQLKQSNKYTTTYDNQGNLKSKTNNQTNEKELYTFNKLNQLTSYTKEDKNANPIITLNYTYDGLNRRVKKEQIKTNQETNQTTTTVTKYLYDQNSNIIALLDENNNLKATIIHNDSIDTPLAIINHKTNKTYYYNKNHLNTILFLTDDNQNIVEEFTYKNAYGEIKEHTINEQTLNPYSYTSRENDTDTLYYYRARYYDPTLKTFISEDPIRYNSGDFNWYRYVSNSPVMYGDAWGLWKHSGNWCGPNWTGGFDKSWDKLTDQEKQKVKKPINGLDRCCMKHDKCHASCRENNECENDVKKCYKYCDQELCKCSLRQPRSYGIPQYMCVSGS